MVDIHNLGISESVINKYLSDVNEDEITEDEVWWNLLSVTDHIPNKIIEAEALGNTPKDYTEVLRARALAREHINR